MNPIFLLAILLPASLQLPSICNQISMEDSTSAEGQGLSEAELTRQCFSYLIEKGEYESIDELEQSLNDEEEKLMTILLEQEISRLESIQAGIIQAKSTCEPVLKWAQNQTHIFVAAKLSHRWDSPPCLRTLDEKYELVNSTLSFRNTCVVSRTEIKFWFQYELYKKSKNVMEVKRDGVGEYSMIFQKEEEEIWPYLFAKQQKVPIWHEIMNRNSTIKFHYEDMLKNMEAQPQPKNWISVINTMLFLSSILIFAM